MLRLTILLLLCLSSCTSLTREDEVRIGELATAATQRTLTANEVAEIASLKAKAEKGGLDPNRLLELGLTVVASLTGVQLMRGRPRTAEQNIALRQIAAGSAAPKAS